MTWRQLAGRCALGFAVGNVVSFVGLAVGDLFIVRRRRPAFASGGGVPGPSTAVVGDRGPEVVVPL